MHTAHKYAQTEREHNATAAHKTAGGSTPMMPIHKPQLQRHTARNINHQTELANRSDVSHQQPLSFQQSALSLTYTCTYIFIQRQKS